MFEKNQKKFSKRIEEEENKYSTSSNNKSAVSSKTQLSHLEEIFKGFIDEIYAMKVPDFSTLENGNYSCIRVFGVMTGSKLRFVLQALKEGDAVKMREFIQDLKFAIDHYENPETIAAFQKDLETYKTLNTGHANASELDRVRKLTISRLNEIVSVMERALNDLEPSVTKFTLHL